MMSKLRKVAFAAALGFAISAPVYAADSRTPEWSDAQVRAAMDKCESLNLTGTEEAKCIVNIRRTPAGRSTMTTPGSDYPPVYTSDQSNVVKDGTARLEEEYAAAVRECEAVKGGDNDRCVNVAKERFGRM
jgi:hypothetical protein